MFGVWLTFTGIILAILVIKFPHLVILEARNIPYVISAVVIALQRFSFYRDIFEEKDKRLKEHDVFYIEIFIVLSAAVLLVISILSIDNLFIWFGISFIIHYYLTQHRCRITVDRRNLNRYRDKKELANFKESKNAKWEDGSLIQHYQLKNLIEWERFGPTIPTFCACWFLYQLLIISNINGESVDLYIGGFFCIFITVRYSKKWLKYNKRDRSPLKQ